MGKTKIKTIDDAQIAEPKKPAKKLGRTDELVEKLKAELGVEEKTTNIRPPKPISKAKPRGLPRAKPRGKKYQEAIKDLDKSKTYPLKEALELVKKGSYSQFTGTLEAHINTTTSMRGLTQLPFSKGKTEYKTEPKALVIHLGLGKLNQPTEELSANITILLQTLGKTKIKKVTLAPTMGPSVKLDLASF